jgi:integrase/recombinase XerD
MEKIELDFALHKGKEVVVLRFANIPELNRLVKELKGRMWSNTLQAWWVPYSRESLVAIKEKFNHKALLQADKLKQNLALHKKVKARQCHEDEIIREKLTQFENWLQSKRYSVSTIKTYKEALKFFLRFFVQNHLKP